MERIEPRSEFRKFLHAVRSRGHRDDPLAVERVELYPAAVTDWNESWGKRPDRYLLRIFLRNESDDTYYFADDLQAVRFDPDKRCLFVDFLPERSRSRAAYPRFAPTAREIGPKSPADLTIQVSNPLTGSKGSGTKLLEDVETPIPVVDRVSFRIPYSDHPLEMASEVDHLAIAKGVREWRVGEVEASVIPETQAGSPASSKSRTAPLRAREIGRETEVDLSR